VVSRPVGLPQPGTPHSHSNSGRTQGPPAPAPVPGPSHGTQPNNPNLTDLTRPAQGGSVNGSQSPGPGSPQPAGSPPRDQHWATAHFHLSPPRAPRRLPTVPGGPQHQSGPNSPDSSPPNSPGTRSRKSLTEELLGDLPSQGALQNGNVYRLGCLMADYTNLKSAMQRNVHMVAEGIPPVMLMPTNIQSPMPEIFTQRFVDTLNKRVLDCSLLCSQDLIDLQREALEDLYTEISDMETHLQLNGDEQMAVRQIYESRVHPKTVHINRGEAEAAAQAFILPIREKGQKMVAPNPIYTRLRTTRTRLPGTRRPGTKSPSRHSGNRSDSDPPHTRAQTPNNRPRSDSAPRQSYRQPDPGNRRPARRPSSRRRGQDHHQSDFSDYESDGDRRDSRSRPRPRGPAPNRHRNSRSNSHQPERGRTGRS